MLALTVNFPNEKTSGSCDLKKTCEIKGQVLEHLKVTSDSYCSLGVKVRNMKMDFNTGGTWRRH